MSVAIFRNYNSRQITKIDLKFEFFKKYGRVVLQIYNSFFKNVEMNSIINWKNPSPNTKNKPKLIN